MLGNQGFKKSSTSFGLLYLAGIILSFLSFACNAQTVPSPTGQYSCLFNRNFDGHNASSAGDGTHLNLMLWMDFGAKLAEVNAIVIDNYGDATAGNYRVTATGSFTVIDGPIKNSLQVNISLTTLKYSDNPAFTLNDTSLDFYLSPVNGSNTLLIQGPAHSLTRSAPDTGVCNKI